MPRRLDTREASFEAAFSALIEIRQETQAEVESAVAEILAEVKARGDEAVVAYTERFDRLRLEAASMRVAPGEIELALEAFAPETLSALNLAAGRIEAYHRRQMPTDIDYRDDAGIRLGARWTPLAAAGLYVPGCNQSRGRRRSIAAYRVSRVHLRR